MNLKYFTDVDVNYKDTGRDSDDAEAALLKFANELLAQLYHEATCEYTGLGNIRFKIRKKKYE